MKALPQPSVLLVLLVIPVLRARRVPLVLQDPVVRWDLLGLMGLLAIWAYLDDLVFLAGMVVMDFPVLLVPPAHKDPLVPLEMLVLLANLEDRAIWDHLVIRVIPVLTD